MYCRLEDECPGSKKLKIRLQSEVNLITFNSSQFPGSSLHCHLGHRHIHPDTTQQNPLEGNKYSCYKTVWSGGCDLCVRAVGALHPVRVGCIH